MKLPNRKTQPILAALLAVCLLFGTMTVPGVFAQEKADEAPVPSSLEQSESETAASSIAGEGDTVNAIDEPNDGAVAIGPLGQAAVSATSSDHNDSSIDAQAEESPYSIEVAFDGKTLDSDSSKNTVSSWTSDVTKTAKITLNKNASAIKEGAHYVLRMKTSQLFYFTGLPDASKVTGIANVTMVQNEVPQVNLNTQKTSSLVGFSPYSGEIRVELNPVSDTVSLTDIGVMFSKELVGYFGGKHSFDNPVSFEVAEYSGEESLESLQDSDFTSIASTARVVGSAELTTSSLAGGGMKTTLSIDGFKTAGVNMQDVVLGKSGTISYAGGTAGEDMQVYKTLTAVFYCPYITVDGQKHYLSTDSSSEVLKTNISETMKCFAMAQDAAYDASNHTITYRFQNIYLGNHTPFFVTPQFSFPEELKDVKVPSSGYKIDGGNWAITEQTCWSGEGATLKSSYNSLNFGTFLSEGSNVEMASSAQADSKQGIAKREICNLLTRKNGNAGALGFFDVHNNGATDSGELDVKFEFNTETNSGATYYVTSVNLPTADTSKEISFELVDENGNTKAGTTTVSSENDSQRRGVCISCAVGDLRKAAGVSGGYYIKSVSYKTNFVAGKAYHIETAHLNRNRTNDGGLFFGFIEGEVGKTASAIMTISASDGKSAINQVGGTEVSSTETSTISTDDYIGFGLREMKLNGNQTTTRLTAGEGASLSFGANVSTEEYRKSESNLVVNGYHRFRDGVFYVALPEGVSIAGSEQAKVAVGDNKRLVNAQSVEKLNGTGFTEDGVSASWWKVEVPGIDAWGTYFTVSIDLSTNLFMQGVQWNFKNHIVVQSGNQEASWAAASSMGTTCKSTTELKSRGGDAAKILASYLENQNSNQVVTAGLGLYNAGSQATMTIARAEAKLDVETSLQVDGEVASGNASLYSASDNIDYRVTVSSTDGGKAEDFSYYVPITLTSSVIDASAWTMKNEFSLKLNEGVAIEREGNASTNGVSPFSVYYTTDLGLTSENVRKENVNWAVFDDISDSTSITAVKIVTNENAIINENESYQFKFNLGYSGDSESFDTLAGSQVQWRTFGRYTYERNGATTTNTYPSGDNTITIKFRKDLTGESGATGLLLDTGAKTNKANSDKQSVATFLKPQTLRVKSVTPSGGTQLVLDNDETVSAYTGSDANTKFSVRFNINNKTAVNLGNKAPIGSWALDSSTSITLMAEAVFSKALTDTATVRYVDIVIGNDDVDITWRVNLMRKVAPATLDGAGLAAGEKFQTFTSENNVVVSQDSALSAQFKVDGFVPGNYADQTLGLFDGGGSTVSFPKGTNIMLMPLDESGNAQSYWWYQTAGSETSVSLRSFKRMSGTDTYKLDTGSTVQATLRYLFVVDFADDSTLTGDYKLSFSASAKPGVAGTPVLSTLPFSVVGNSTFALASTEQADATEPSCNVEYTVNASRGQESALEHKSLALVLKPQNGATLPIDAVVVAGDKIYARGADGSFVIPLSAISTGNVSLSLRSVLFPVSMTNYGFDGQLYLSRSSDASTPMNGTPVGNSQVVTFAKAAASTPSVHVTGARVAAAAQWAAGQDISLSVSGVPSGGNVTVTAFTGVDGTQKVTDLLSSVAGAFTIQNGVGALDASKVQGGSFEASTGKLVLSNSATPGTYRLQFEIKDANGTTLQSEPYVIIVR